MRFPRSSGVLLHLTSLPGQFGIGDFGAAAYRFVDFLAESGQSLWQILPLGPTSGGNYHSPYVALSAFAGSALLISLETLVEDGLLPPSALSEVPTLPEEAVDYDQALLHRLPILRTASERFASLAANPWDAAFAEFCRQQHWWLDDYALFMALREVFYEASWDSWEPELVRREPLAVRDWGARLVQDILFHKHLQFF